MTTCYICGRPFEPSDWRFRHKLKTGESISRTYTGHTPHKVYVRYDMHQVCKRCHDSILAESRRKLYGSVALAAAGVLFIAWALTAMIWIP